MRLTVQILGVAAILAGLLFLFQGLGVIRYPLDSFMIDNRDWVLRGGIIAAIGALLVASARLLGTRV